MILLRAKLLLLTLLATSSSVYATDNSAIIEALSKKIALNIKNIDAISQENIYTNIYNKNNHIVLQEIQGNVAMLCKLPENSRVDLIKYYKAKSNLINDPFIQDDVEALMASRCMFYDIEKQNVSYNYYTVKDHDENYGQINHIKKHLKTSQNTSQIVSQNPDGTSGEIYMGNVYVPKIGQNSASSANYGNSNTNQTGQNSASSANYGNSNTNQTGNNSPASANYGNSNTNQTGQNLASSANYGNSNTSQTGQNSTAAWDDDLKIEEPLPKEQPPAEKTTPANEIAVINGRKTNNKLQNKVAMAYPMIDSINIMGEDDDDEEDIYPMDVAMNDNSSDSFGDVFDIAEDNTEEIDYNVPEEEQDSSPAFAQGSTHMRTSNRPNSNQMISEPITVVDGSGNSQSNQGNANDFAFAGSSSGNQNSANDFAFAGSSSGNQNSANDFAFASSSSGNQNSANDFAFAGSSSGNQNSANDFAFANGSGNQNSANDFMFADGQQSNKQAMISEPITVVEEEVNHGQLNLPMDSDESNNDHFMPAEDYTSYHPKQELETQFVAEEIEDHGRGTNFQEVNYDDSPSYGITGGFVDEIISDIRTHAKKKINLSKYDVIESKSKTAKKYKNKPKYQKLAVRDQSLKWNNSVLFSEKDSLKLQESIMFFENGQEDSIAPSLKQVPISSIGELPSIKLDSLIFSDPDNWKAWINNSLYNDDNDKKIYKIAKVSRDYIRLVIATPFIDGYIQDNEEELVEKKKFRKKNGMLLSRDSKVILDPKNGSVILTIEPREYFDKENLTIGNIKDATKAKGNSDFVSNDTYDASNSIPIVQAQDLSEYDSVANLKNISSAESGKEGDAVATIYAPPEPPEEDTSDNSYLSVEEGDDDYEGASDYESDDYEDA